ncbi:MAG: cysteine hydrolase family protein [Parvibaculaceae bacterium]
MDHIKGLRHGPLSRSAAHLCIDMQRLFADDSPWASDAVRTALPAAAEICRFKAEQTIFTRFICPRETTGVMGQWRRFYDQCPQLLSLDPRLFDVVPELARFMGDNATIVSRLVFSAFHDGELHALLRRRSVDTLVFSGVETDVCVLATALAAIDIGYRVVVVEEGVASSNRTGHQAAMTGIFPRFDQQVELVGAAELLARWSRTDDQQIRRQTVGSNSV